MTNVDVERFGDLSYSVETRRRVISVLVPLDRLLVNTGVSPKTGLGL